LPDFSHAVYACGEQPLPKVAAVADVARDFGARGDGRTDDSEAFLKALATVGRGAIFVPPGRYAITRILEVIKPGIVLRGAGPRRSVLVFPRPLNAIRPDWGTTTTGQRTSNYSWSGGVIWFRGSDQGNGLGSVAGTVKRGSDICSPISTPEPERACGDVAAVPTSAATAARAAPFGTSAPSGRKSTPADSARPRATSSG
jgi:hypothetical protein